MKIIIVLLLFLSLSICNFNGAADNQMHKYGEKASYSNAKELKFPDFSISFAGKREENISKDRVSPLKIAFYDFEVTKAMRKKRFHGRAERATLRRHFLRLTVQITFLNSGNRILSKVLWVKAILCFGKEPIMKN